MHIIFTTLTVLVVLVPILLSVAYVTLVERKLLASLQRRVGPNTVGVLGLLQPFADAAKLAVKEPMEPSQSTAGLYTAAPVISLVCALLSWTIMPIAAGGTSIDVPYGWLVILAIAGISVYGILLAGWSSNSAYAFVGSLRSTASLISYELVFATTALLSVTLAASYSLTIIVESQQAIMYGVPLFLGGIIFIITTLAEAGRTPFDLPEAESELVAGFMTEYAGMRFVSFFLAEYSSLLFLGSITSVLLLAGYFGLGLGVKAMLYVSLVVWLRGTLPRLRYDQLMTLSWSVLLPLGFALIIMVPSIVAGLNI